jgi:hypothetical protein
VRLNKALGGFSAGFPRTRIAFPAPGLTLHHAAAAFGRNSIRIGILLFLLSNQKVAFEYLLSNRLSPSNICFQIDHHPVVL